MSDGSYVTSSQKSDSMPGIEFAGLMKAVLEKNVPFRFTATGCSMTPFIRDGDLITISPVPLRLRPGDVVPFVNPSCNKLMVHRILNVSQEGYLIKGDNNSEPDGRIPASSIIGRVVRVEHRGRQVRFGLGTESLLIAWLSQCCWLTPLVWSVRRVIKPFEGKRTENHDSSSIKQLTTIEISDFPLWAKMKEHRGLLSFDLEITARCNNNCRHCYINLPAGDRLARSRELTLQEIGDIADQAVVLGAVWVLISGGEPLLREDFHEIYLLLKRKGLLVSVFTNATLVRDEHIALFRKYPPRDIEITVYGSTEETYERVTGRPGSFAAFTAGLNQLLESGVKVRLKAMAIRSNFHELPAIADFCHARTKDYFRFDPQLHLRFDHNEERNLMIKAERLTPEEIVALERADVERFASLQKGCDIFINEEFAHKGCDHLFHCGLGTGSFNVGYDGTFRLCSSLWAPDTIYDLRQGTLREAWEQFVPKVRDMRSRRPEYLENCRSCPIVNLCLWCPAHAHLETGELDTPIEYFCRVARARAAAIQGESQDA